MSAVSKRTSRVLRHEYAVPSPSARSDVEKAITWALSDMPENLRHFDDACTVEASDDEIIVWWTEEEKTQ